MFPLPPQQRVVTLLDAEAAEVRLELDRVHKLRQEIEAELRLTKLELESTRRTLKTTEQEVADLHHLLVVHKEALQTYSDPGSWTRVGNKGYVLTKVKGPPWRPAFRALGTRKEDP